MQTARPNLSFDRNAAFRAFKLSLKRMTVAPTYDGAKPFVLVHSLIKWWKGSWDGHGMTQVERLHHAVYANSEGPFGPISASQLSRGCLRVFSILLDLQLGHLVHKFQNSGIEDSRLPVSNLDELHATIMRMGLGLENAEARNLAQKFHAKQWSFCPVDLSMDMSKNFDEKYIMPICQKQRINDKGGSATGIYLIEVQEEFVSPDLKRSAVKYDSKEDSFGFRCQFALKTFHRDNYDLFENERRAFSGLRDQEGMVGYLGWYSHVCDPLSSFSEQASHVESEGMEKTWNILLEYGDLDLDEYFLERLPPVFADEILGFWEDLFEVGDAIEGVHNLEYGKGELAEHYYGWHADIKPDNILSVHGKFKLADPGFAHFVRKTDDVPMGEVLGGTETFGAPECHPSRRRSSNVVHQTIDIWSLGCVFSIAATWVALGHQGILQYAELRREAVRKYQQDLQDRTDTSADTTATHDCFHDEHVVLQAVTSWHKTLRMILRKTDTVTSLVLDLVDTHMLLGDPTKRLSAGRLCDELKFILGTSKEVQSELMIEIPQLIKTALCQLDSSVPATLPPKSPSEGASSNSHRRSEKSARLGVPMMKTTHRSTYYKPSPESPRLDESHNLEDTQTLGSDAIHDSRRSIFEESSLGLPIYHQSSPYELAQTSQMASSVNMNTTPPRKGTGASNQHGNLRAPPQNVFQAKQQLEKEKRGTRGLFGNLKKALGKDTRDKVLSSHLGNRDLVFLVDNATTMIPHWDEATNLLEVLVKKAEGQDPNGPDLHFTLGNHRLMAERRSSAFTNAMRHESATPTASAATDIRVPLGHLFEKYLGNTRKAMTIIVLTDGLWEGVKNKEEVSEQIVTFIKKVRDLPNNVVPRRVSIEFIQFGTDEAATARLKHLDDNLKDRGIPDVIDTEPSNGDVYKMLLGSLVENYDGDANELQLVESPERLQYATSPSTPGLSSPNRSLHSSSSSQGPFTPPPRTDTDMSQHTLRAWGAARPFPPSESSQRNKNRP
ncbi:kinase-like domain-containing protein [Rhexocercosporidium sp. MPI-PUGE-AT-0058]|nr:kinase-like domain-containing protein [Rhexocercosporidium sp. MPI-PUGE-AT-0058]